MADIFISYSQVDRARIVRLSQALTTHGFSVWWDRHEGQGVKPGQDFDLKIEAELENAACVIVSWSEASRKSRYVRDEARRADKRGVIVPVLIERVDPPLGFASLHTEDLSQWDGDTTIEPWQRLVLQAEALTSAAKVKVFLDHEARQIRPPVAPINTTAYISIAITALIAGTWFLSVRQQMGVVGATLTLAFLAYTMFRQADQDLRPHMKALATRWLLPKEGLAKVNTPEAFLRLFEAVFGRRHFSWLCFWRSAVASMICYTMVFYVIDRWNPNEIIGNLPIDVSLLIFFVLVCPVNFIGDYVSLGETRLLLHVAANRPYTLPLIVCFDAILTFIIFSACLFVLFPLVGFGLSIILLPLVDLISTVNVTLAYWIGERLEAALVMWQVVGEGFFGWSLSQVLIASLATAYITSIWLWMVLIFVPVVRLFVWSRTKGTTLIGRLFDLQQQPFTALGFIMTLLILAVGTTVWVAELFWA